MAQFDLDSFYSKLARFIMSQLVSYSRAIMSQLIIKPTNLNGCIVRLSTAWAFADAETMKEKVWAPRFTTVEAML